jgi:hypothetical protein
MCPLKTTCGPGPEPAKLATTLGFVDSEDPRLYPVVLEQPDNDLRGLHGVARRIRTASARKRAQEGDDSLTIGIDPPQELTLGVPQSHL